MLNIYNHQYKGVLHHSVLCQKPSEVIFDIELNPNGSSASTKRFFQAVMHQLRQNGKSSIYHLHQHAKSDQKTEISGYSLIGSQGDHIAGTEVPQILAFVILEQPNGYLELRLGLGNHRDVAQNAPTVKAAGDVYFMYDKQHNILDIVKFTDQSGGYYIDNTDPLASAKKESAKAAMRAVGLPMDKFHPFVQPPLLFSHFQNTAHNTAKKVLANTGGAIQDAMVIAPPLAVQGV